MTDRQTEEKFTMRIVYPCCSIYSIAAKQTHWEAGFRRARLRVGVREGGRASLGEEGRSNYLDKTNINIPLK